MQTDVKILKDFISVLNRKQLTPEIYESLLKRWDLDKIDLDEEMNRINQKKSTLSRSRRDAVPEFLRMKKMLEEKNSIEQNMMNMSMNQPDNIAADTLTNI